MKKGSSSSSILVDLHFVFSGAAEDAAICLYAVNNMWNTCVLFRCKHNVVLPMVCSQDHNVELVRK